MTPTRTSLLILSAAACLAATSLAPASNAELVNAAGQPAPLTKTESIARFESDHQNTSLAIQSDGSISRIYGKAFSHGQTSAISAQRFVDQNAAMWGVTPNELLAEGPFEDGHHTQPIGYLPKSDSYKFTGHYYKQAKDGIPVFRSKLVLLVRNEANNPLVLASSELHDLSNYQPDNQVRQTLVNEDLIMWSAQSEFKSQVVVIESTERVIFAGINDTPFPPTIADKSTIRVNGIEKYLILTDAVTGTIIYQENLIHTIDITGNASALATEGPGSDNCQAEVLMPLPYLSVGVIGGNSSFTDVNGNFTIPNAGGSPVTVSATLTGQWFRVTNNFGAATSESAVVTPPGPADLLFNSINNNEQVRAQANAYIQANLVRDFVVAANPAYPSMQQAQFPVNVNQFGGFCPGNAWYDGASINFCNSGSGFPNTAWSSVIHHEYGHHLVSVGGSGQGQYGEGMGDVMSTIILDDPRLGLGFFGNCNGSLRNAVNNHQFPCSAEIHDCGQLISGSVWDTRNALIVTEPANYTTILNFLAVNSILVHSGDLITPQITIDWLTLDDDDADIGNGTPHYSEIAAGFGAHNMDAPALNLISISYPAGQPDLVDPNGGTTMTVNFTPLAGTLDPASPRLLVDAGAGFISFPMTQITGTSYQATFPNAPCGSEVVYYITSQTMNGTAQNSPSGAPVGGTFSTLAAFAPPVVVFEDNFQTNQGWTVTSNAITGTWNRGVPVNCNRGDPNSDFDGSGKCFLTANSAANACDSDVDDGSTTLTSPIMDASGGNSAISYARWYDNMFGLNPGSHVFVVEVSDDGGTSWVNLETVGPTGAEVAGGWFTKQFSLATIPGFIANNQFRIRFTASDSIAVPSVIEAGVDAVKLISIDCNPCIADMNGDGMLNFFDVSAFLSAFSANDPAADFTGDGVFNFFDVSAFLAAFSAGCP